MILLKPLKKIEEGRGVGKREFTIAFFHRVEGLPPLPPPPWLALATTSCIYVLVKKVSLVFRNFRISNVICMQCHYVH